MSHVIESKMRAITLYNSNKYSYRLEDYQLISFIGPGCVEGIAILLAKHLPTDSLVTLKRLDLDCRGADLLIKMKRNEMEVMSLCRHLNIQRHHSAFVADNFLFIVLPLAHFGSAEKLMENESFSSGLPEAAISHILRSVLDGLVYLHRNTILHRGIRARHILLDSDGRVKLAGLSCATTPNQKQNGHVFGHGQLHDFPADQLKPHLNWLSPDILSQSSAGYSASSDIYSVGITACELANGCAPFCDMPPAQMLFEKLNGTIPRLLDQSTVAPAPPPPNHYHNGATSSAHSELGSCESVAPNRKFSREFHQFVDACFYCKDSSGASRLLSHPFLKLHAKKGLECLRESVLAKVNNLLQQASINKHPDLVPAVRSEDAQTIDFLLD